MIVFGALSTLFDLATFALPVTVFHASMSLFQSGWFIESALTQMIVLITLRTRRAFFRSRPDALFGGAMLAIALITRAIPFPPFAGAIGFTAQPLSMVLLLFALAAAYLGSLELVKRAPWSGFDRGPAIWPGVGVLRGHCFRGHVFAAMSSQPVCAACLRGHE